MIFSTLNKFRIPYIVIKYKIFSPCIPNIVEYNHQILIDQDSCIAEPGLHRLGFKPEREIYRYRNFYMYRNLTPREVSIFRGYKIKPTYQNEDGAVWEIGGRIRRYRYVRQNTIDIRNDNEE